MQQVKYDILKEVLVYLKCLYNQCNFRKLYRMESDIRAFKHNNIVI